MELVDATNDFIRQLYLTTSDKDLGEKLGLSENAVQKRRKRMGLKKDAAAAPVPTPADGLDAISKLLMERGVSAAEIGNVSQVTLGSWKTKENPEGSTKVVLKLAPKWEDGPEWPVVQPATPKTIKPFNIAKKDRKVKRAVIFPDVQIGYRLDGAGNLDPFHDERAMAVALAICKDVNPDLTINLGDYLDFAEFGRFAQEASFAHTTQRTLNRGYDFICEVKSVAPNSEEDVLFEGNHDRRLQNAIEANAVSAFGLQQANKPESWPVMSLPHLLRLDELGITYVEGYPAGEYWINDRLRVEHGHTTAPRGKIAAKIVDNERVSTITGHTHRLESVYKTTNVQGGAKVNLGYTMGCLCRIDGAVPSTKSAIDSRGRPMKKYEDWQQAVGVVEYVPGDGWFDVRSVLIHEGEALFDGKVYCA